MFTVVHKILAKPLMIKRSYPAKLDPLSRYSLRYLNVYNQIQLDCGLRMSDAIVKLFHQQGCPEYKTLLPTKLKKEHVEYSREGSYELFSQKCWEPASSERMTRSVVWITYWRLLVALNNRQPISCDYIWHYHLDWSFRAWALKHSIPTEHTVWVLADF